MGNSPFYCDIMSMHPEVTGSCNLVVVKFPTGEKTRFIVDCGIFQEREYETLNESLLFDPDNIDFCLVTHNHVDHVGRLPFIVAKGYRKKIYATETTAKLLQYSLTDSYKVLKDTAKRNNKKPLYSEPDVATTINLAEPCKFNKTVSIGDNIKVTFFKNGHLIGAALILVQISCTEYDDINLLFTGDYNDNNIFFDVDPIPEQVLNLPLTIIQESTYGYMDSEKVERKFCRNVEDAISEEKTVVVPVFSLGRAQEILYEIKCMQDKGSLDTDVPVYLDGNLAIKYTCFYLRDESVIKDEMRNFLPKNLTFVDKSSRSDILKSNEKKIILTTSGMGTYGPAQIYIPEYISRPNALIHFTGYTAEGTLGNRLKKASFFQTVAIGGLMTKKLADVEYTKEFSAHAKADQMIGFLKGFNNLNLVLVNHGEQKTKEIFAESILNEVNTKHVGILGREYFFRVNPYGLQKTLSTKFK